ncbi:hypothetical protein [Wielerella bovis]|uniref:hypothetical protein n=1 Tax=Wielerella bovis TaxID=2917790 RepID=UPI0020185C2F|nr:hypothetical protein [Wielerella bovis]ULJ60430.1 hypothetical protein MIS44_00600 [Wielerella bovis]
MSRKPLFLALALSAVCSSNAFADTLDSARSVNQGLSSLPKNQSEVFYQRSSLAKGKTADHKIHLEAGKYYTVYGDCDDNCTDLNTDLLLNGAVVDKDHLQDSAPIINVSPERSADYVVRASMVECSSDKCDYHINVINRGEAPQTSYNSDENENVSPTEFLNHERERNLVSTGNTKNSAGEVLYKRSSMATGAHQTFHVNLKAGQPYKFYADCAPNNCSDINLKLSHGGKTLEEDTLDDHFPLFSHTPEKSGRYTLRVDMKQCQTNKCEFHVHALVNNHHYEENDDSDEVRAENLTPEQYLDYERKRNLEMVGQGDNQDAEIFYQRDKLATGKSADFSVNLKAKQNYRIFADCSPKSCGDINMELLHDGKVLDKDTDTDVYPMLFVEPEQEGKYTVRVNMAQCKEESACEFQVQIIDLKNN